jgi:hypothetical protein
MVLAVTVGLLAMPSAARSQMTGLPVAQNAFVSPGITLAANFGTGDPGTTYAGAAAWAPSQRFGVAIGGGVFTPDIPGASGAFTWGTRATVALPFTRLDGPLGLAAFGGVGGASVDGASELSVPVGVSVGYRAAIGDRRGVSVYVAPLFRWTRVAVDDESISNGLFRGTIGFDVAVLPSLGVSIGYEFGAEADETQAGPTGALVGIGISWAFRR